MEKVRFEAFNVEELRVLRRACYEAGAAFGDPGHTAAERATLDDLGCCRRSVFHNANKLLQLVLHVRVIPAAQDAQRWRYTAEEPPKEEDGDCCGRVLIAHAGAHCAVATSLQYARENPEAVRVWMPLPKLPWEEKK